MPRSGEPAQSRSPEAVLFSPGSVLLLGKAFSPRELADRGAGVLLITHDLEQALAVADRVAVFYAGTTVEDADVKAFIKEETAGRNQPQAFFLGQLKAEII